MSKKYIKLLVNESLAGLFEKTKKSPSKGDDKGKESDKEKDSEDGEDKEEKEEKVEYSDIKNFFDKHESITKVGVFREAGFSEEDIYQRLPYKKLDNEKNEMGGVYRFSKDEVDRLRTVLDKYPRGN